MTIPHPAFNISDRYKGASRYRYLLARGAIVACRVLPLKILALQKFTFAGRSYAYCAKRYNAAWSTERTIEVPIAWHLLQQHSGKRILEVGNVLSHYFRTTHQVLDKYEQASGVLNLDVVDFVPPEKYDLILSISTLEHVGWDEQPRDPEKVVSAIHHLRTLLKPEGELMVTVPLGHHMVLDEKLREGQVRFQRQRYMKRVSDHNDWTECSQEEAAQATYNFPYPGANVVVIGIDRG